MIKIFFLAFILIMNGNAHAGVYLNLKALSPLIKITKDAEGKHGIPDNLLTAIAHMESKCSPYAVNARGRGFYFKTKEEAVAFVEQLIEEGTTDINIGYMQLHYPSHKNRFASVADMIDPSHNIAYAAKLLKSLYKTYGSWEKAVERYKSDFCESSRQYQRQVYGFLANVYIPQMKHHEAMKPIGLTVDKKSIPFAALQLAKMFPQHSKNHWKKPQVVKTSQIQPLKKIYTLVAQTDVEHAPKNRFVVFKQEKNRL